MRGGGDRQRRRRHPHDGGRRRHRLSGAAARPGRARRRLLQLRAQPDLCAALGRAGYLRAHRFYTWRGVADRLVDVYRDVAYPQRAGTAATRRTPVSTTAGVLAHRKENA